MSTYDMERIRTELAEDYAVIDYVEETGSTNTDLMQATDVTDGTVRLADLQTAGKGRLGRVWTAPKGSQVTFSVLLLPESLDHLGTLPLAAGLAVTDAIPGTVLKWPNDVLLDGKKLCGILAEAGPVGKAFKSGTFKSGEMNKAEINKAEVNKAEINKAEIAPKTEASKLEVSKAEVAPKTEVNKAEINKAEVNKAEINKTEVSPKTQGGKAPSARVVLGMGINVSIAEEELPVPTATSLVLAGREDDRTGVAIAILKALRHRIEQWENQDPQLMDDYRKVCSSIGLNVRLEAPTGDVTGIVEGVAEDGRINVGGEYYSAGDVIHLRPTD
ncbi:biotin--[acetyl-CoA-carboxylase] ligase [Corynebacterium phoceense]|uniref:biotin--[acetyl-CoA-carboxylase] ligase n=1 Tax=Corynebacterium phoceense TaxID=1686286 RepID=UPI00211B8E7E|nr:biotin--[acetyl-CoA-carboxylase] ligase [Corynebacterium phoceense]MCQ9336096.1 biotin--[acetyl-CoA-carboxylase] ligase [Corynebacterium phoceense]